MQTSITYGLSKLIELKLNDETVKLILIYNSSNIIFSHITACIPKYRALNNLDANCGLLIGREVRGNFSPEFHTSPSENLLLMLVNKKLLKNNCTISYKVALYFELKNLLCFLICAI